MADKHSFHVELAHEGERDITADDYKILDSGALVFLNAGGKAVVAYAPGAWVLVEHETRDDRG